MAVNIDFSVIDHKWTDKQMACLQEYVRTGKQLESYFNAYNTETRNSKTAKRAANALFKQPYMVQAVELIREHAMQLLNEKASNMVIDAAWVLKRAALLADFNIRKFIRVDDQGNAVYDFSAATDDDWYCISEYTVDEIQKGHGDGQYFVDRVKIKTTDKLRALEIVGKHVDVQAFKENLDLSSKDGSMSPVGIDASKLSNGALAELLAARTTGA